MRHLTREDFLSFNLGASLDDYIIPGLNLIPKVRKLTEKATKRWWSFRIIFLWFTVRIK